MNMGVHRSANRTNTRVNVGVGCLEESGSEIRRSRPYRHSYLALVAAVVVAGLMFSVVLAGCSGDGDAGTGSNASTPEVEEVAAVGAQNTITVAGEGKVTTTPDEAVVTLAVESDGADAAQAMDSNSQAMQTVVDRLRSEGVEESAIKTANVTLYPIRTYDPQSGKESLTGYRAQNMVTVTLKDALKVGEVLAAALETGATNVSGPEWRLSDDNAAVAEALGKAVSNARIKAEAVAKAEGVKLGAVLMMNETGVDVPVAPLRFAAEDSVTSGVDTVTEPPVSAGTLDVTANITVTYSLTR